MNLGKTLFALAASSLALAGPSLAGDGTDLVLQKDLTYQPLNAARGDASPQAGVLWGDLKVDTPTGAIIKFKPGFSSPPHIHNITYRAVVIEGAVHNDDPNASTMWMGPGSFWSQPAGEDHITSAISEEGATIFLEILEGPYLVQPSDEAFENDEHPINVDAGNVVWLESSDLTWIAQSGIPDRAGPQMAFLWGAVSDGQQNGTFLRIPSGSGGRISNDSAQLRAVLVKGEATLAESGSEPAQALLPGSYVGAGRDVARQLSCDTASDCVFYVSTEGRYTFEAGQ